MIVTPEFARNILSHKEDDWEKISEEIVDQDRWSTCIERIYKYQDKFYQIYWWKGSTEYQEHLPFEGETEVEFVEVKPVQKMVTVYEPVN